MAAFEYVRRLGEVHDHLTAAELKPGFVYQGERARGRFAARFRNNADPHAQVALAARLNGWAPRNAWRHHVHAAFVPWLGPVFWPYVYSDIFDYTFWPEAYDDAYWAYAYDDLIDTVFWDNGSP